MHCNALPQTPEKTAKKDKTVFIAI